MQEQYVQVMSRKKQIYRWIPLSESHDVSLGYRVSSATIW